MAVLKKNVNVGLAAVLIVFTTCVKLLYVASFRLTPLLCNLHEYLV